MILIASDHAALNEKAAIIKHLQSQNLTVEDLGPFDTTPCDYPDYAQKVCEKVSAKKAVFGILICGTGIGMSIAANKIHGIRCALCGDTFSANQTRLHNDTNVLALGARVVGQGLMLDIVDTFVKTRFSNEPRHKTRIQKMMHLEKI